MGTAERIFDLVDAKYKEQRDFAKAIGVSASMVSQWRMGITKSYTRRLPQIAEALGTTTEYLLTGNGPKKKTAPAGVSDSDTHPVFYDNYIKLCNQAGKAPSFVAEEIGLKKSAVTSWKKGRTPTDANLQKIASYFGVTVESLIDKKNAVSESDTISEDDIKAAFFEGAEDLTKEEMDALWEDARDYMLLQAGQRRKQQQ